METKSKFITFILSFFVPGAGHLYLGVNVRGLQFMASAFACIILMSTLPLLFPFVLAIVWFYSMFDALQRASAHNQRLNQPSPSQGTEALTTRTASPDFLSEHPMVLGGLLIVLGIFVLLSVLFPGFWALVRSVHVGSFIIALVLIGFGVWIIRGQRK